MCSNNKYSVVEQLQSLKEFETDLSLHQSSSHKVTFKYNLFSQISTKVNKNWKSNTKIEKINECENSKVNNNQVKISHTSHLIERINNKISRRSEKKDRQGHYNLTKRSNLKQTKYRLWS